MAKKSLRQPEKNKRLVQIGASISIVVVLAAIVIFFRHNSKSLTLHTPAEQIVRVVASDVSTTPISYKVSDAGNLFVRLSQDSGAYMRPIIPHGYKFLVFPMNAFLLKITDPYRDQSKIVSLLDKGFAKRTISDKTVQMAVEYESSIAICYLEVPKPNLHKASIFGCADKSSYAENAQKVQPLAVLDRYGFGNGAYDTPVIEMGSKPGYEAALLPAVFTPGDVVRDQDTIQRYGLSEVYGAYYRTPSTNGWVSANGYRGGYPTISELCTSSDTQAPDIQISFSRVCAPQPQIKKNNYSGKSVFD